MPCRRDRARIDEECSFAQGSERARIGTCGTEEDFFERGRIADDGDEDVGLRGGFAGIRGEFGAGADEVVGFGFGTVPDGEGETGAEEILRHGFAHQAQAYESD